MKSFIYPTHLVLYFSFLFFFLSVYGCFARVLQSDPIPQLHSVFLENPGSLLLDNDADGTGIIVAARSRLIEYAKDITVQILNQRINSIHIPPIERHITFPFVGDIKIFAKDTVLDNFQLPNENTRFEILDDGSFRLSAQNISLSLSFFWGWKKSNLHGSGTGSLILSNVDFDFRYRLSMDTDSQKPFLSVVGGECIFNEIVLNLNSFHNEWAYKSFTILFRSAINRYIQQNIDVFLGDTIPDFINEVIFALLPNEIPIGSNPQIITSFKYHIGFHSHLSTFLSAALSYSFSSTNSSSSFSFLSSSLKSPENPICPFIKLREPHLNYVSNFPPHKWNSIVGQNVSVPPMVSLLITQTTVNCMLWALFSSRLIGSTNVDSGTLHKYVDPDLDLSSDLLSSFIPDLAERFPGRQLWIKIRVLDPPVVSFAEKVSDGEGVRKGVREGTNEEGISMIKLRYQLTISFVEEDVSNEEGTATERIQMGSEEIFVIECDLSVTAAIQYESTKIESVVARHTLVQSNPLYGVEVDTVTWDSLITLALENYGGSYSLKDAWDSFGQPFLTKATAGQVTLSQLQVVIPKSGWTQVSFDVSLDKFKGFMRTIKDNLVKLP